MQTNAIRNISNISGGIHPASSQADIDRISAYWRDTIGKPLLPPMQRDVKYWVQTDSFDPELIELAIDATAIAPYPSWRYLQAIVARLRRERKFYARDWYED